MVPLRQRLGRTLTILALTSLLGVFAIAWAGCGSGGDETSGGGTVSSEGVSGETGSSAGSAEQKQQATAKSGRGKGSEGQDGSKGSGEAKPKRSPSSKQGHSQQTGAQSGDGKSVCPKGMSRAECKRRIEAVTNGDQTPSQAISGPSDCVEVLGKKQCKEIIQAQKEAEKESGSSVSPETCLDEYSRGYCEKRFGEQAERQAGQ
ncbi:MAG TPA: hypothetical protein VIL21_03515 [Solirubrobacterales bacterium]|jgi:hypothetical protein